jgi:YesN/AraC family two-component response regulator
MGYFETIRSYLILILIHMMRQIEKPNAYNSGNEMIRHILDYVDKNYTDKLSLNVISQKYNYTLQHVSTLFKKEVGVTFQEYVQSVRIKESCRLLINTDQKVADIATKVGYTNIKFFNEVFKRHMEMTPRDFRKKFTKG